MTDSGMTVTHEEKIAAVRQAIYRAEYRNTLEAEPTLAALRAALDFLESHKDDRQTP